MNNGIPMDAISASPIDVRLDSSKVGRNTSVETDFEPKVNELIRWAFYAFVVTIPFESIGFFTSEEGSSTITRVLGFVFAAIALTQFRECFARPPLPFWLFVAYLAATLVLGLFGDPVYWLAIRRYLLTLTQNLFLFWLSINVLRDRRVIKGMLLATAISCSVLSIVMEFGIATSIIATADGQRLSFADADPNCLAFVLIVGLLNLVGLAYVRDQPLRRWKILLLPFYVPLVQTIVLTGSRSAVASLGIGAGSLLMKHGRGKTKTVLFIGILLVFIGSQVLKSDMLMSRWGREFAEGGLGQRQSIALLALSMVADRPILGWGPISHLVELSDREGYSLPFRDTHNDLLWAFASTGIIGGTPFLLAAWFCLRDAWASRKGPENVLPLALILVICVMSLSVTIHKRKIVWILMAYAVSSGSAVAAASRSMREPLESDY